MIDPGVNASMATTAVFPRVSPRAGMYESFYLRAVSPQDPVGVWIRITVHKRPGQPPLGSVWCTVFDATRGGPYMHKITTRALRAPAGKWIAVGEIYGDGAGCGEDGGDESHEGACLGPGLARGCCGEARWSLRFDSQEPELRHLARGWLYRAPLPRTKLTSPAPMASFVGSVALAGREVIELAAWPGMVGHNWGSEHAERWIWLHGVGFAEAPEAWIDVALGRVKLAGRMTPWLANGALSLHGRRWRLGGLSAHGLRVHESASGCRLVVPGEGGLSLEADVRVPPESAAGWRYADPAGGEHDVVNCSVARLELRVRGPHGTDPQVLVSDHGGAYELGVRERDHGVPVAPFGDG